MILPNRRRKTGNGFRNGLRNDSGFKFQKHLLWEQRGIIMGKTAAIVLSAGSGKRMHSDIPKQYLELHGKPVIYYSLKAFQDSDVEEIVLVADKDSLEYCRSEIVNKYGLSKVTSIVPGGAERYDSVFEGLQAIQGADYVLIHDGARPMLTAEMIARSLEEVQNCGACVLGMPVKDTIKVADSEGYAIHTPDRSTLWQVQTPQTFSFSYIYEAYEKLLKEQRAGKKVLTITDDAMVLEYVTGKKIKLVEGGYENIKITTPEDLAAAEIFLKRNKKSS